jgi:hypothetical protein
MSKDLKDKPQVSLIPWEALKAITRGREYGLDKYGNDTHYSVNSDHFLEASIRHIYKYWYEDPIDHESKLHHLDHAITSLALAIDNLVLERKE